MKMIGRAKVVLEPEDSRYKSDEAFDAFIDGYFEDMDFEYLYDNFYDSLDETEPAQRMGISSFHFHDWFKPFSDDPSRTPHPSTIEADSTSI